MWFNCRRDKILGLLFFIAPFSLNVSAFCQLARISQRTNSLLRPVLRFPSSGSWWGEWNELECFQTWEGDATYLSHWLILQACVCCRLCVKALWKCSCLPLVLEHSNVFLSSLISVLLIWSMCVITTNNNSDTLASIEKNLFTWNLLVTKVQRQLLTLLIYKSFML